MADWQDRATAYACMEEWEKQCNDYSGKTVYELANEVLRLRAERDASRLIISDLTTEVERLRAAGDALAAIVGDVVVPYDDESKARTMVAAYDAWKEARRG